MSPADRAGDDAIRSLFARQARGGYYDLLPTLGGLGSRSPIRRRMVAELGLRAGDHVLDIGCGTGLGFGALERAVGRDGEIVGVDFTPEMLARAARRIRGRGWGNVRLVESDARALPFDDGDFAGVCSTLALSGGPGWHRALQEAWRVLEPGGRIAMIEATPLRGPWKLVEPALVSFERRVAAWQPPKPRVDEVMRDFFQEIRVEAAFGGLWTIIAAGKT